MICPDCGKPFGAPGDAPPADGRCPSCRAREGADARGLQTVLSPAAGGGPPAPGAVAAPRRISTPRPVGAGVLADADRPTLGAGAVPEAAPMGQGEFLGRFLLVRPLGAGGMGVVYQAWDTELDRTVALKLIRTGDLDPAVTLPRFLREARLAAQLRHPHIVGVYDVGQIDGRHFIAMDYVEGMTLEEHLEQLRLGTVAVGDAADQRLRSLVELLLQVADAVSHAHGLGIIHRDLKPANVLIDKEGRARVTDFGLAKEFGAGAAVQKSHLLTAAGQALGTPGYMSPEQATADTAAMGPQSDVWTLGVMLYELLTGSLPFEKSEVMQTLRAIVDEDPSPPTALNPQAPRELETICLKALDKSEHRRYPTAREFAEDLRRWLRAEPVVARRASPTERMGRWVARRKSVVAGAAAALLLVATAFGWVAWERTYGRQRSLGLLREVSAAAQRFEDQVLRTELPAEARAALAEQPLGLLAHLIELDPEFGPAYAWRGRVRRVLGRGPEADEDFDRAVRLSPEFAVTWALRGIARIQRYAAARGLPSVGMGPLGMQFERTRAESADEQALREAGLADLEEADRRASAEAHASVTPEERTIGRALAALHGGAADAAAQAVALLAGLDRPDAGYVRGVALYYGLHFEEAVTALNGVLAEWPQHVEALFARALAQQAIGLARHARGKDGAIEAYAASIADFDALAKGDRTPAAFLYNARAASWTHKAQAESDRGLDPVPSLKAAIVDYAESVRRFPGYAAPIINAAVAYRRLAEAQANRGQDPSEAYRTAIAIVSRAVEAAPQDTGARNTRGMSWLSLAHRRWQAGEDVREMYGKAVEDFTAALAVSPKDALLLGNRGLAWKSLASAQEARGQDPSGSLGRAIEDLTAALAIERNHFNAWLNLGSTRSELADWKAAHGADPRPDFAQAIADFGEAIRVNPQSALAYSNRGNTWSSQAENEDARGADGREAYRRAIEDHTEALKRNPDYLAAQHNRAEAWRMLALSDLRRRRANDEALRQAEADSSEVIRRNPTFVLAWVSRGTIRTLAAQVQEARGGDPRPAYREAIADLDECLARAPEQMFARTSRAATLQNLGRSEEARGEDPRATWRRALADLDAVLERTPGSANALASRATVWSDLGRAERARGEDPLPSLRRGIADFDAALGRNPALPLGRGQRGTALLALGEAEFAAGIDPRPAWTKAAADATAEIERDARAPAGWNLRGCCRQGLADVERALGDEARDLLAQAEADLRTALERGDAAVRENLATVLRLTGRDADAAAMLEALVQQNPARRAWVETQLREMERGVAPARDPWTLAWREASAALGGGRADEAVAHFARGFTALELFLARQPADVQARRRAHAARAAETAAARYDHACALLRAHPDEPAIRGRAMAELEQARSWGFRDADHARGDPDLAPLRGEARFEAWLGALGR